MGQRDELIEELGAERAITRIILKYAHGIDQCDFDKVRSCFHSDARIHYGERFSGALDETMEWLAKALPKLEGTQHVFGPPWIELDLEAGSASCETYALNTTRYPPNAEGVIEQRVTGTRYLDRFERRNGEWRIVERRNLSVWAHTAPETPEPPMP